MAKPHEMDDSPAGLAIILSKHHGTPPPMDQETDGEDDGKDGDEGEPPPGLEMHAHQLIEAIHANDVQGVTHALWNAFAMCDEAPHEEGPNEEEAEPAEGE